MRLKAGLHMRTTTTLDATPMSRVRPVSSVDLFWPLALKLKAKDWATVRSS
jgi:hypothetical protein